MSCQSSGRLPFLRFATVAPAHAMDALPVELKICIAIQLNTLKDASACCTAIGLGFVSNAEQLRQLLQRLVRVNSPAGFVGAPVTHEVAAMLKYLRRRGDPRWKSAKYQVQFTVNWEQPLGPGCNTTALTKCIEGMHAVEVTTESEVRMAVGFALARIITMALDLHVHGDAVALAPVPRLPSPPHAAVPSSKPRRLQRV